jgi:hypothetical protein
MDWINYRLTEHLSVGAGLGGGYSSVDTGSNSIYEQIQGRVNWRPSEKLTLGVNGGVEIREFTNLPGSSELVNPLMGADVSYHVFEPTFLTFTANRSVGNSILPGNLQEAASVSGGISQRLLGHYTLDLSVGYRSTDYKSTLRFFGHSLELLRQEDYTFVSVGLRTTFLRKGTVSVGYLHGDNESTLRAYQYASDQFSFRLGYRY